MNAMLEETADGLYCAAGAFHIDPWGAVPRAVITHAHGDHARAGSAAYLCAAPSAPLLARRFGPAPSIEIVALRRAAHARRRPASAFHPAGHVLGSAQIRIEGADGVWVVSGDYKRAADPTCAPFEPVRVRHVRHRVHVRRCRSTAGIRPRSSSPTSLGVVGRQPRRRPDVGPLLLHARQGAAPARRAGARHRSPGARARRHGCR